MKHGFGLTLPQDLGEICASERCALIVYDMQNGIVSQIPDGQRIVSGCKELLEAARGAGMRVFFTRHFPILHGLAAAKTFTVRAGNSSIEIEHRIQNVNFLNSLSGVIAMPISAD